MDNFQKRPYKRRLENKGLKPLQGSATLKWLSDNYELVEGVCLPRCILYEHYIGYCANKGFSPASPATFGKIIRQQFPAITTRRLGTRGQSKYHYYGIGIQSTSPYYHAVYSKKGFTRFSGAKVKTEKSRKCNLNSKTGTLLPEFIPFRNIIMPENLDPKKVQTFLLMYRTHCQRIIDAVTSAKFDEVEKLLLHFWPSIPDHVASILDSDLINDIVPLCDNITYKILLDVLIPTSIQDLPNSLYSEINYFIKRLPSCLMKCLEWTTVKLKFKKLEVTKNFIRSMTRHLSFIHLAQATRNLLVNQDTVNQMVIDFSTIDFESILNQLAQIGEFPSTINFTTVKNYLQDFKELLQKFSTVEAFVEWLDNIVTTYVIQPAKRDDQNLQEVGANFFLWWSFIVSLVTRDLTLHSSESFGSYHLLYMMFNEYIFLVLETLEFQENENIWTKNIARHIKNPTENLFGYCETIPSSALFQPSGKSSNNSNFMVVESLTENQTNTGPDYMDTLYNNTTINHDQSQSIIDYSSMTSNENCMYTSTEEWTGQETQQSASDSFGNTCQQVYSQVLTDQLEYYTGYTSRVSLTQPINLQYSDLTVHEHLNQTAHYFT